MGGIEGDMDWNFGCWLDDVDVHGIPVQVVVSEEKFYEFPNLAAARELFPELNPIQSSDRFTWAMRGELNGTAALRFETLAAYQFYSE